MALILVKNIDFDTKIGLWSIEESVIELKQKLGLFASNFMGIDEIKHEGRQRSSLAVRLLIQSMIGDNSAKILKNKYGKPFLENNKIQIGMSHSGNLAAGIISSKNCGIDIQIQSDKVIKIAHKFLHKSEETDDPKLLHLLWCAKEAIYKADGRKRIEFKDDIIIVLKDINSNFGSFKGILKRKDKIIKYNLQYEIWNEYYLVYAIEA